VSVVDREEVASVDVSIAFLKSRKSVEEASAAVVSKDGQDEVIWMVFGSWVLVPIERVTDCEKGLSAWVSRWMSCPGVGEFGEVVMEMMAAIGIAAIVDKWTIKVGYVTVQAV
jgi:aspartokinase-like uncharacterized kinase